jgi:hypothetical protein
LGDLWYGRSFRAPIGGACVVQVNGRVDDGCSSARSKMRRTGGELGGFSNRLPLSQPSPRTGSRRRSSRARGPCQADSPGTSVRRLSRFLQNPCALQGDIKTVRAKSPLELVCGRGVRLAFTQLATALFPEPSARSEVCLLSAPERADLCARWDS